jgi:hypothetical protein
MELLAGEPEYVVEHVGFIRVTAGLAQSNVASVSTNPIAGLRSTSPRFTGILGCIPNTIG